jgi:hypothetical protein
MTHYRVRVARGDVEVEVDSSEKEYTDSKLKELLANLPTERVSAPPKKDDGGAAPKAAVQPREKKLSMAEYIRSLAPKSGPQHVVAVGLYLEQYGGMGTGFKTRDIADGFTTVKYKHSNPAEAVRQAKTQGLLMDGKEPGTLVVTSTGEDWVKVQLGTDAG